MKKKRSKRGHAKPKAKKSMPKFRKTNLPDEMVVKKPSARAKGKERSRVEFNMRIDEEGTRNEQGKEDFDRLLRGFLGEEGK